MTTAKNTPSKGAPAKKRGLGRGLEALLGPKAAAQAPKLEATPQDALRTLERAVVRRGVGGVGHSSSWMAGLVAASRAQ